MGVEPAQPFFNSVLSAAIRCAADTGLLTSVVLAQWADETAFGTSRAWVIGNNPAGISPNGVIASYPSQGAGFAAYIECMNQAIYDPVRAAKPGGAATQAYALGASPWAGGHYTTPGGRPGYSLVDIIAAYDLGSYDGNETAIATAENPPPPPDPEVLRMFCTDNGSGKVITVNEDGNIYADPGITDIVLSNLTLHPTFQAGAAESGGANPCVGITPWLDTEGKWGYCFVTKPTSGSGSTGLFNLYHFTRAGIPH